MKPQKANQLAYFSAYFIAQVIYIYVNAFLPIFFREAFSISGIDLGLVLYTSYMFMLSKPLLAIYISKEEKTAPFSREKKMILAGAIGAIITFTIFIFNLSLLVLFGVLLGLNFLFVALMDVFVDKGIIERSTDDTVRKQNAFYIQLGGMIGGIIPNVYFFLIRPDNLFSWNLIFLVGTISLACSFFPLLLLKEKPPLMMKDSNAVSGKYESVNSKRIFLACCFLFFAYGVNFYEWVLEPWAINRLEEVSNNPKALFPLIMIVFIVLDAMSLLVAGKYSKKLDKNKVLFISVPISGVMTMSAPFLDISSFFLLIGIVQLVSGFFLINMIALIMEISNKKVLYFQVIASSIILSKVILAPLGLSLFDVLPGEVILSIAGLLQLISLVPLYLLHTISLKGDSRAETY